MKIMNNISNGSIHIERNFLEDKLFNKMSKEISKLKYKAGHQPSGRYFGNRFQAYPVNEALNWPQYKRYSSAKNGRFNRV